MRRARTRKVTVKRGSTNVFADLGFRDAKGLQLKAELTRHISGRIKALNLSQSQASKRLGLGQPDISRLMKVRYTGFSVERLLVLLCALAVDVQIVVCSTRAGNCPGRVSVLRKAA